MKWHASQRVEQCWRHALVLLALGASGVYAQVPRKAPAATQVGATSGQKTFAARCAGCHGLDGRGSPRAPNIATEPATRHLSDLELEQILFIGRTDYGMPAFGELGSEPIRRVVEYLRTLQGVGSVSLAGNPQRGAEVFFGKAACSTCHTVAGQAVFVGSDLSNYAQGLTQAEIRKSITDPSPSVGRVRVAVATRGGRTLRGAVRNEDNFSIQLQSADGAFHFLQKSELDTLEYQPLPPMPTDYGKKLSAEELDDLVGYLQSIKTAAASDPRAEQ